MSDPSTRRPVLRADLRLTPAAEAPGAAHLSDPISGNAHRLTPIATQLAALLDGQHTLEEAAREVAERLGEPVELAEVVRLVADLEERMLLESEPTRRRLALLQASRRRRKRLRMGILELRGQLDAIPAEQVQVREGLRYGCLGCGVCCSGRFRVELNASDETRLRALDLEGQLGRTFDDVLDEGYRGGDDPTTQPQRRFLAQEDGRCVFLAGDNKCEIHRHFGYQHKPLGCRIFPFYPIATPEGAVLQFRPECSTQHLSARSAPLVAERAGAIWDEIVADLELAPSVPVSFELRRDLWSDYRSYRELEAVWVASAGRDGWRAALGVLGHDLALRRLDDLRPVQSLLAMVVQLSEKRPERTAETFATVLEGRLDPTRLGAALLGLVGLFRTDTGAGLEQVFADVAASAALLGQLDHPALDAQLDDYVRDFLFGKYAFQALSVASGCGLLCLIVLATRLTAACTAALCGVALDARLFNESLIAWHTSFFNHDDARLLLLQEARDELEAVVGLTPEHYG